MASYPQDAILGVRDHLRLYKYLSLNNTYLSFSSNKQALHKQSSYRLSRNARSSTEKLTP